MNFIEPTNGKFIPYTSLYPTNIIKFLDSAVAAAISKTPPSEKTAGDLVVKVDLHLATKEVQPFCF